VEGYDTKRIYVWYDAVIGYFSAAHEWASLTGNPEAWRDFWQNPDARSYYFIGKDNIPFHTIIWPAMLLGYGDVNLPYDVPANEYLNFYGRKFSKSRGNMVAINDVLERYQADAWRYVLTAIAPEGNDVDFAWDDFVDRVNGELVANWGNLVNRMLSFAYKRCDGRVPEPGPLLDEDKALLDAIEAGFKSVGDLYGAVRLRAAATELLRLSTLANGYITATEPFRVVKVDPARAATIVYTGLQAIDWLSVLWAPILPHTSQQVREMLGHEGPLFGRQYTETIKDARGSHLVLRYDHSPAVGRWAPAKLTPGQALREPVALFVKLDPAVIYETEPSAKPQD
jgi:methionyl-tRNA synthetase